MIRNKGWALIAALAAAAAPAQASADFLRDYDLIVTGNLTSNSEVEGRTIVGGNLSGPASNYAIKLDPTAYKTVDTLIVGGNLAVTNQINMQAGVFRLGGSVSSGGVNLNNGSTLVHDSSVAGIGATAASSLLASSAAYAALTPNSTVTAPTSQPGPVTFNAQPGANGVAVFQVDGSIFSNSNVQQYQINLNGATSVIFNVSGTSVTFNQGNFTGAMATSSFSTSALFNFYQATSLTLNRQFYGAVLAPNANLTNSTSIEGAVFVKNFTQNGEVHLPNYTGYVPPAVPEPASAALAALGLPVLWLFARRARRAA